MTLNSALSAATMGLAINQRGLEIASHNIANVNTAGYSKRILNQESAGALVEQARGVNTSSIERLANDFLSSELQTQSTSLGRSETRDRYLTYTQDFFGTLQSDNSISQRLADMMANMETLAVQPESPTAASALIDDAVAFARDLNTIADEVISLRREADLEIDNMVDDINTDLTLIAELNQSIMTGLATAGPATDIGDLQDQRDLALLRISEKIDIKSFTRGTGEVVLFTGDARMLLDGDPILLDYQSSSSAGLGTVFSEISLATGDSMQSDIQDGALKGLLDARDTILPDLHRQLDALAENARDIANAVHNRGMGIPAATTLTGNRTFADSSTDNVTLGSDARFVVTNPNGVTVAAFDLTAGTFTIDDLAAAIDVGLGADGTAAVVNGALQISATDPNNGIGLVDLNGGADMAISFDDGSGPQAFEGLSAFFGLNDFFVTPGAIIGDNPDGVAGLIQLRSDLITEPARISRGQVTLDAVTPVAGVDRAITVGDGTIMADLAAAFAAERSIASVGGLPPINKPLHEFAAEIVGANSQLAVEEKDRLLFEEAMVEQFQTRLTDATGVNMDEELANILVLQNAFAASARVVSTADEMMEILVNMKR